MRLLQKLATTTLAAFAAGAIASAQDAAPAPAPEAPPESAPSPADEGVEEIVVTITKRAESVQDISGNVAAFNQDTIESANIENVGDLIGLLPNVTVKSEDTDISVRGVARVAFDSQSPVAYHINGVYQFNSLSYVGQFYDLQNVAIALGPSGTLYGRNANGGAINIEWRRPDSSWGVTGDVTYAPRFDNYQFRSVVNIPLSGEDNDLLNARFVLTREVGDGAVRNPAGTEREGAGSKDDWYSRLYLTSQPTENLRLDLRGSYLKSDKRYAGGVSLLPRGTVPQGVLPFGALGSFPFDWASGFVQFKTAIQNSPLRPIIGFIRLQNPGISLNAATELLLLQGFPAFNVPPLVRDPQFFTPISAAEFARGERASDSRLFDLGSGRLEIWSVDGGLEWNLEGLPLFGDVDLFALAGYSRIENEGLSDSDATSYGALDTESSQLPETKRTFELRFQSNNESWLNWTLGFFYVNNKVDQVRNTLTPLTISGASLTQQDKGYAPFANVVLKPIDPIEIFLGVRWNHDEFSRNEDPNPTPFDPVAAPLLGLNNTFRETTLDASVKWFINEDHMVYVKWARGYKAGFTQVLPASSFGGSVFPARQNVVQPETNIATEIVGPRRLGSTVG
ncbi:MAG: TonB-dependent receptor [Deltaproteobacteria bacterium]|nr:TonB-dependent receptor [Deltaproteobacteria bacterium]